MSFSRLARIIILQALCAAVSPIASAQDFDLPVDLELVLAVDVSSSMKREEQELQRGGYVTALRSPRILRVVEAGAFQRIAVTYVEWGDSGQEEVVIPWTLVEDRESADRMAARLAAAPVRRLFGTSLSSALLFSAGLFHNNGFDGQRKAIDISSNGPNNTGPPVEPARDLVIGQGIAINGLPIMLRITWGEGLYSIAGLDFYFEDCVIGGPNSFMVVVRNEEEFADAIERKMVLEISAQPVGIFPIAAVQRPKKMDCLAGEKGSQRLLPLR